MDNTSYYFADYYRLIDDIERKISDAKQNIQAVEFAVLEGKATKKELTAAKRALKSLEAEVPYR